MAEYRITVQDTGIGMDEEFQKHAFEAFEEDHKKAVQAGMDGFVIKLIKVDKLMQEIQLLYEKN